MAGKEAAESKENKEKMKALKLTIDKIDKDFGKWFFGIWLNKNTSEPKLRKDLIG